MESNTFSSSPEVYSNLLACAQELCFEDCYALPKIFAQYFRGLKVYKLSNREQKNLLDEYLASKEECVITEDNWNQE